MRKYLPILTLLLAAFPFLAWAGEEKTLVVDKFDGDGPRIGRSWEIYVDANDLGSKAKVFDVVKDGSPPKSKGHGFFSGHIGKSKPPYPWISLDLEFMDDGPKDVSAYMALRFQAKGEGKKHRVRLGRVANEDHCYYEYVFLAPKEWTQITAPLKDFVQPKWGKQIPREFNDVTKVSFLALAPGDDEDFTLRFTDVEFVAAQPEDKSAADKKSLQGNWIAKRNDNEAKLTFEADKFTLHFEGKKVQGTIKIDASQSPKHIDMIVAEVSDNVPKEYEGKTSKAIFELDGNRFKWYAPAPSNDERPAAFPQDGEEPRGLYLNFEREKK